MLQQLRVDYELIVLDLPGHGQDPSELNPHHSINQLDEWIRVTKARLPQRYDLMGWSLGGQIAIRMAHNDSRIQRLILMAVNPKFILLDEPFAGIDPIAVADIQSIITQLKSKGIGVLITDHSVRETLSITDHAYIINDGEIITSGKPMDVAQDEKVKQIYLGNEFYF